MSQGTTTVRDVVIEWIGHAAVKLEGSDTVLIDVYPDVLDGDGSEHSADIVIATHPHFDHFDPATVNAAATDDGTLVARTGTETDEVDCDSCLLEPGDSEAFDRTVIEAVEAYNDHRFREQGQPFHPQGLGMGVLVELDGLTFYHAGDTDHIDEMNELSDRDIDVAFLPIGGTYTMDADEAIEAVAAIEPHKVVPIHYGTVDGTDADPYSFQEQVEQGTDTDVIVLGD